MKALVTGASGFIGSHLVEKLLSSGYEVSCLVRKTSNFRWLENPNLTIIHGDCADKESLNNIRGFDYIFHLAGLTKANCGSEFYTVNTKATENIVEIVPKNNPQIRRFVYLSSLSAFGPSLNSKLPDENHKPHPVSDYGNSKLMGEEVVLKYRDRMPISILRPSAVYGPRDKEIFLFFKLIKRGILPYWGKGHVSLVYIDDLINAIILSAEKEEAVGEVFFISDGMVYSNEEVINEIANALEVKLMRVRLPKAILPVIGFIGENVGKVINKATMINRDKIKELMYSEWVCDISKAKDKLGFMPKVKLKEGIKWTAEWYKIHRWI
ncbi:MAG: NAD(P)-dependent oxidoreductase [Nitrospirae bacterium]|nr:NAD(P)-dependent oxidoreductase [Nitrospirota bacterium]